MRNTTPIQSVFHLFFRHLFTFYLACLSALFIYTLSHAGGITTDGSIGLGLAKALKPGGLTGHEYTIPSYLGEQKGTNLFHSFGNFNVDTGYSATFTGPAGTTNVIGRVTGGNPSSIDGRLACDITGANLWLLNPFGILFGSHASLDVKGSFHASTAEYLQLSDGGVFYTNPSKTSKLTTAPPSTFGFLSSKPAGIEIKGSTLEVPKGESLSIIGGDIRIEGGHLVAPGGRVNLASLGSPGTVEIVSDGQKVVASNGLGNIYISDLKTAIVDNSGNIDVNDAQSGSIYIYCKTFSLDHSVILSVNTSSTKLNKGGIIQLVAEESASIYNSSVFGTNTYKGAGGDIDIQTGYLVLTNGGIIGAAAWGSGDGGYMTIKANNVLIDGKSRISCSAVSGSTGNAGSINIDTESLKLSNGGYIASDTYGSGNGGDITIKANNVSIDGGLKSSNAGGITSQTISTGNAGSISIDTESLFLSNRGQILTDTNGSGDGGNVTVKAKDVSIDGGVEVSNGGYFSAISSRTKSTGNAGSINIDTESLTLTNAGYISAATSGSGNGGDITINAKDVLIDGGLKSRSGGYWSSDIECRAGSTGNAGDINIDTESLTLSNGGQILTDTYGRGNGGDVTIKAKDVSIDGGVEGSNAGYFSTISSGTESTGNAGSINIDTESLTLSNGGQIAAATSGSGNGGNMTIKAKDVSIDGGFKSRAGGGWLSEITCKTKSKGNAGGINIDTESLTLSNGGQITAATSGSGNGGNMTIKAKDVSINGGFETNNYGFYPSTISCQAYKGSTGNAGSLFIDTESLTLSNGGQITAATSGSGNGGNVTIKAKDVSIDGGVEGSDGVYLSEINCRSEFDSSGKAGNIILQAGTLSINDGGQIAVTNFGKKAGGNIGINVDVLNMNSGAVISSASTGTGNAGNINLTVADKLEIRNSTITTESTRADGGDITITTGFLTWLVDSAVTATVAGGPRTTGGNIRINSPNVVLNNSQVIANAYAGKGGSIGMTADTYLADWTSTVSASSTLGINGQVDINSPPVNLSGLLSPLPTAFVDISELLANDCETRYKHRKASSLVVRGRDALPAQPGDLWPSPVMMQ